jgi:hypothetical protein
MLWMRDWRRFVIGALCGALLGFLICSALTPERVSCNVTTQPELCLNRASGVDGWRLVEVHTIAGAPFVILERPRIRI